MVSDTGSRVHLIAISLYILNTGGSAATVGPFTFVHCPGAADLSPGRRAGRPAEPQNHHGPHRPSQRRNHPVSGAFPPVVLHPACLYRYLIRTVQIGGYAGGAAVRRCAGPIGAPCSGALFYSAYRAGFGAGSREAQADAVRSVSHIKSKRLPSHKGAGVYRV